MSEALAAGASAIVTAAIPAATITNELAQAKADHVPVVLGIDKNVTTPAPRNIAAVVSYPYKLIGQLDADWVIANSGGTANVLVINVQGSNPLLMVTQGGSIPQLAKVCPKCNVTVQNVPLANLSEVASITTTALQSNPKISYVIAGMDTVAGIMIPAIKQVGYENKISITGLNGSLQEMLMMAQGTPMKMDVATAGPYLGYAAADQVLRLLAGVAPSRDEAAPVRVFNQSTVHSIKLTQSAFSSDVWFNPNGHFLQKFWALWGVKP
jgi:ribose transport system substrate-binding protein